MELTFAFRPEISRPHRCFIGHPISASPQPALTVVDLPGAKEQWLDSLVIVPADAPHGQPTTDPLVSSTLGLIRLNYEDLIDQTGGLHFVERWSEASWTDYPYSWVNSSTFAKEFARVIDDARDGSRAVTNLIAGLEQVVARHFEQRNAAQLWTPVELSGGVAPLNWTHHWQVLQMWRAWDAKNLPVEERYDRYFKLEHQPKTLGAFKKRLAFLRLKARSNWTRQRKTRRR